MIIFSFFSKLLIPSWSYPNYGDQADDVFTEFYELPKNSIQVLFIGASHIGYGISPCELYKSNGIVSYNMGTSNQGLDSSLLALKEVFKNQTPQLVFFDISKFNKRTSDSNDRNMLYDNISFGRNKLRFALANSNGYSITNNLQYLPEHWQKLIPIYQYHSRWKEISHNSFNHFVKKNIFLMGYNISL